MGADALKALGVTPEQLKSVFGITGVQGAINEAAKTRSDPTYGKIGNTPGARAETDTPEGTHRDANGNLIDDSTGLPVGGAEPIDTGSTISIPELSLPDYNTPDEDYVYAGGGLIDLLHKMRSYK
jgi:hypothetical protein